MENLLEHLKAQHQDFAKLPHVLQLNKRDLPDALPVKYLRRLSQRKGEPIFEAVASRGLGVFETLREISRQVLAEVRKG